MGGPRPLSSDDDEGETRGALEGNSSDAESDGGGHASTDCLSHEAYGSMYESQTHDEAGEDEEGEQTVLRGLPGGGSGIRAEGMLRVPSRYR